MCRLSRGCGTDTVRRLPGAESAGMSSGDSGRQEDECQEVECAQAGRQEDEYTEDRPTEDCEQASFALLVKPRTARRRTARRARSRST